MKIRSYVSPTAILFSSTLCITLFTSRPAKADHERISIDAGSRLGLVNRKVDR